MKNLSLSFSLLLFMTLLTSCLPEATLQMEEPAVVAPAEEEINSSNISYGNQSLTPNYAYLRTTPNESEGGFNHTLLLTRNEVTLRDGDLEGFVSAGIIGISFTSATASPEGNFPVLAEDAAPAETGVRTAGGHYSFGFINSPASLMNHTFASGAMDITLDGDTYKIELDIIEAVSDYSITGRFVGGVTKIVLPEAEPVTEAEFSGENLFRRDEEEFTLRDAYLVEQYISSAREPYYKLFLTEESVENTGASLRGTTNAVMMKLRINDELKTGRYQLGRDGSLSTAGFFARAENDYAYGGYLCRDMNFETDTMLDDEPMDVGEVIILVEESRLKIKFNYESSRGALLTGEYHGSFATLHQ